MFYLYADFRTADIVLWKTGRCRLYIYHRGAPCRYNSPLSKRSPLPLWETCSFCGWGFTHILEMKVGSKYQGWLFFAILMYNTDTTLQFIPPPTKTYTTLIPIFAKRGVFFQWGREIKKRGSFCRHGSTKLWKRVKFCMYICYTRTHFCEKGGIFSMGARNQEKGVILQAWVREILKMGKLSMYLSFNHDLKVMKNTTYIEKYIEFDVVTYILTLTSQCLLGLEVSDFGLKRAFFSFKICDKCVFFTLGYEHGTRFVQECEAGQLTLRVKLVWQIAHTRIWLSRDTSWGIRYP